MTPLFSSSWRKIARRLFAGAAVGLAITGSALAQGYCPTGTCPLVRQQQQPAAKNYQHLFDAVGANGSDFLGSTQTGYSSDFGPDPTGAIGRGWREPVSQPHRTNKPVFDGENLWRTPSDFDLGPANSAEPSAAEKLNLRLSSRYGNPVVERFIKGTSANRFAELYLETSRLIDSRHIEPATYQARVGKAAENLRAAMRNPEFRRVHGLNVTSAQEQAFARELDGYLASQNLRSSADALRAMSAVTSIAGRTVGLPASAVAAEFVYGATEALDEYSAFNPEAPATRPSAATGLEDSVVGIGVEIKPHDEGIVVVKALRGSPAERAGLQRGDIVTNVNGQALGGRSMDFAVDQIAGPQASPVIVSIVRDGRSMQLSMRRERVRVYSVSEVQMIDPAQKVGYVKLDKFAESTSQEMDEALWTLHRQGMQTLVLDLRGNPGGLLTTAVELSDKFLPSGTIVSTRGRTSEDNLMEQAGRPKTWKAPVVVIVDEHSASASEIFAAAIQENGRGLVVGRKSYGKGTVQTHFPLRTVSGNLKITTAKFYSPKGRVMAGAGVTPDVMVPKLGDDQTILPLASDRDVQEAVRVATGREVRELAAAAERGDLLSRR